MALKGNQTRRVDDAPDALELVRAWARAEADGEPRFVVAEERRKVVDALARVGLAAPARVPWRSVR